MLSEGFDASRVAQAEDVAVAVQLQPRPQTAVAVRSLTACVAVSLQDLGELPHVVVTKGSE